MLSFGVWWQEIWILDSAPQPLLFTFCRLVGVRILESELFPCLEHSVWDFEIWYLDFAFKAVSRAPPGIWNLESGICSLQRAASISK